jgi:hypothetical protein
MGDPNQRLSNSDETPFDAHPASAASLRFALTATFRFGSAGAACYNRLVPPETPLLQGFGPDVAYVSRLPADASRIVFVGRTNVGALEDAFRAGVTASLPVYVTDSIKKALADMRSWLDRGAFPHTTAASAGLVADPAMPAPDEAGDVDEDGVSTSMSPWTFFYSYNHAHYVDTFLHAFENASLLPSGGPSSLPAGAPCVTVMSTTSAIGSDLADFCVCAARDCFDMRAARGHGVVALTRATGRCGVAVSLAHDDEAA